MSRNKPPNREHKQWTRSDEKLLKNLARENTPTGLMAWELGRTKAAVYNHASAKGISLEPPNPKHKKR